MRASNAQHFIRRHPWEVDPAVRRAVRREVDAANRRAVRVVNEEGHQLVIAHTRRVNAAERLTLDRRDRPPHVHKCKAPVAGERLLSKWTA